MASLRWNLSFCTKVPRLLPIDHCVFLKNKIQEYLLTFTLIGWTLSYTASAREMHLVFATPMVGMKPVNLCLPELCSLACIDTPTALRNREGGYAPNIDFISSYLPFVFELVCCILFWCLLSSETWSVYVAGKGCCPSRNFIQWVLRELLHQLSFHLILCFQQSISTKFRQTFSVFSLNYWNLTDKETTKYCCPNFI